MEPQRVLILTLLDPPHDARSVEDLAADLEMQRSEVVGAAEELARVGLVEVDGETVRAAPAAIRMKTLGLLGEP